MMKTPKENKGGFPVRAQFSVAQAGKAKTKASDDKKEAKEAEKK